MSRSGGSGSGPAPPEIDPADEAEALAELRKVEGNWLRRPGVTAVDVGFETKNGRYTGKLAIRVHVARKLPLSAVPEHDRFPERLGRFPVDVQVGSYGPQAAE
jgi:hypothetical protein